jgi:hypothetical protein
MSARHLEKHVFFGNAASIAQRLSDTTIGSGRRLFYVVLEGHGQDRVYEYEHHEGNTYTIRAAHGDAATVNNFDSETERTMAESLARSCVGELVQNLSAYKSLQFESIAIEELVASFPHLLPSDDENFYKLSFNILC